MRLLSVAALVTALAATGPALAWEAGQTDDGYEGWFDVHVREATGKPFELAATCSEDFAGEADIAVYSDDEWPAAADPGFDIEMRFDIDGRETVLSGDFGEYDMRRMVMVEAAADPRVWDLFDHFASAKGYVTVSVAGETLRFDSEGASVVVGDFIARCK